MRMTVLATCIAFVLSSAAFIGIIRPDLKPDARSYPSLAPPGTNDDRLNLFISGHSLTDRPMPDFLAGIAGNAGLPLVWNRQHIGGSSVRQRSLSAEDAIPGAGFAAGTDRDGNTIDVREEFRNPSTHGGKPYDLLLITEQHRLLDSLLWQDGIRSLRIFQDTFIAANAVGKSYVFVPWLDLSDRTDPSGWIAYERNAWPFWQCTIASVNDGLAADGRSDRLHVVPASLALAELVDHLSRTPDAAGFEGFSTERMIDMLFADGVHLTPLANHYIAAVTFSAIYGRPMVGETPADLDLVKALTLRTFAEDFVRTYRKTSGTFGENCGSGIPAAFALRYASYVQNVSGRHERGAFLSRLDQVRDTMRYAWRLRNAFAQPGVEGRLQ